MIDTRQNVDTLDLNSSTQSGVTLGAESSQFNVSSPAQMGAESDFSQSQYSSSDKPSQRVWPTLVEGRAGMNVGQAERAASLLGGLALATYALRNYRINSVKGFFLTAMGANLAYRGLSGQCSIYKQLSVNTASQSDSLSGSQQSQLTGKAKEIFHSTSEKATQFADGLMKKSNSLLGDKAVITIQKSVVINKPADEVFRYWRSLDNLGNIFRHIEEVRTLDERRSHWKASTPMGLKIDWDAEITEERENDYLAWKSVEPADIRNSGWLRFRRVGESSTELTVNFRYEGLTGVVGSTLAKILGQDPARLIEEDLEKFKSSMESGQLGLYGNQLTSDAAELH